MPVLVRVAFGPPLLPSLTSTVPQTLLGLTQGGGGGGGGGGVRFIWGGEVAGYPTRVLGVVVAPLLQKGLGGLVLLWLELEVGGCVALMVTQILWS